MFIHKYIHTSMCVCICLKINAFHIQDLLCSGHSILALAPSRTSHHTYLAKIHSAIVIVFPQLGFALGLLLLLCKGSGDMWLGCSSDPGSLEMHHWASLDILGHPWYSPDPGSLGMHPWHPWGTRATPCL